MRSIRIRTPSKDSLLIEKGNFKVIAGPCSIESEGLLDEILPYIKEAGAHIFRGGVYKLRTRADSFQGLGTSLYQPIREARQKYNLPFITEITDIRHIEELTDFVDIFQVGSRNMYNYPLLKELGKTKTPVLLKRAFSATLEEWIAAAGYLEKEGNPNVILCERGIRTFEQKLRNTLDLGSVAFLKKETDYPVIVDPSHATGRRDLVLPMALAAIACGADGIMVEVHPRPEEAHSDGLQSLDLTEFKDLMVRVERLRSAI